jgi:stage II sporulation protein D
MKKSRLTSAVACILAAAFLSSCAPSRQFLIDKGQSVTARESSYVKVLIKKTVSPVRISAAGGIRVTDLVKGTIEHESNVDRSVFSRDSVKSSLRVLSSTGIIDIDGTQYRGMAEIHNVMGSLHIVNVVKIEDYLCSVVPGEISVSWPIEAIRAQAVAARTYAYYHIMKRQSDLYDLDATNASQVYKGISVENDATTAGVRDTEGQIMVYENQPILAFFHSTCGGSTVDNDMVWSGEKIPYLAGRECKYCKDSPYYRWTEDMPLVEVKQVIATRYPSVGRIEGIRFAKKNGRVVDAIVRHNSGQIRMTGNEFRMIFPEKKIKSMYFDARKIGHSLHVSGRGWGHGVGMCQFGMKGMAHRGANYRQILTYYYRGIAIESVKR